MSDSFRIIIRAAHPRERQEIEACSGKDIASDACVAVWLDARLVGWGDDYGTFHLLPALVGSVSVIEEAGERLLAAAVEFWEAEGG